MDFNLKEENGIYTCDYKIGVNEWLELLKDNTIFTKERLQVLELFYNQPEHKATCKGLAQKYLRENSFLKINVNILTNTFDGYITQLGRSIANKLNISITRTNGKNNYYSLIMMGKYVDNGSHFEWTIVPNLVEALEKYL